ncbi:TrbG/VirB9 family P-type conjugative transfer protein [Cognatishimia sp. D5M38]|uniref:TrbG/VirB9 family P-type conjugative transfer protein n=1 Tax=Cognatishimia coralii TaxID=3083254 RepID=A0ABU8QKP9_9RHOB
MATASLAQEDVAVEQLATPKTELIKEELGADPIASGSGGERFAQETGAQIAVDEAKTPISNQDQASQSLTSAILETTGADTAPSQSIVQQAQEIQPVSQPSVLRADDQTERMISAARQVQDQTAPVALGKAGRVIVTYGEALPVLVCTSLAVCTVELEKGENLVDAPVLGDPVRWIMEQRQVNWPGQEKQWIFVFKPTADADRTSTAVFVTDRRIYSIVLKRHPFEYIPILSFDYPDTRHRILIAQIEAERAALLKAEADELKRKADAAAAAAARATKAVKASGTKTVRGLIPAEKLDFNYKVTGRAPFKPAQVYNDGRKTYVVLPSSYKGSLPVLLAGESSSNAAINISFKDSRFVIDRLVSSFTLKDGSKTVSIKRISS